MRKIMSLLLLFSGILAAQDVKDIVKEIQEKYEDIEYLSADFIQIEQFKLTGSRSETKGKIFIKDGIQYRLETEDQSIATDGKSVWTYNKFTNQVLIDRVKPGDGSLLPRDLLFKYPKDYMASLFDKEKIDGRQFYILKLDPKEDVYGYVKSMKIWVDSKSYIISKIEYNDFNDNTSMFEVREIDTEKKLPDGLFIFQIKEGMDVVDLRM